MNSQNKAATTISIKSIFLVISLLLVLIISLILNMNIVKAEIQLDGFPRPFVSSQGTLNFSVVVPSSVGHGPCGGAHTMDVMGAVLISAKLGLEGDAGMVETTMDDYISILSYLKEEVTKTVSSLDSLRIVISAERQGGLKPEHIISPEILQMVGHQVTNAIKEAQNER